MIKLNKNNGISKRIRNLKFINRKFIEDFNKGKYSTELCSKFQHLETLKFIDNKETIILMGTPSSGKTHYAIGLGIRACMSVKMFCLSRYLIL